MDLIKVISSDDPIDGNPEDWDLPEGAQTYPFIYLPTTRHVFLGNNFDVHGSIGDWFGYDRIKSLGLHPGWDDDSPTYDGRVNIVGEDIAVQYGNPFALELEPDIEEVKAAVLTYFQSVVSFS